MEAIIRAYGLRFKIETGFDDLKNDMGCFNYHFWSKSLPKKKRWQEIELPIDDKSKANIARTKQAIETHVSMCSIAYGIMTIIGFTHTREIWDAFSGWLRTVRSPIPSIATTRNAIAQIFYAYLPKLRRFPVFDMIALRSRFSDDFVDDSFNDDVKTGAA